MKKALKLGLAAAVASAGLPTTALAAEGAIALEEVIVTAQKRSESIQDVPISIAAFSQESLEAFGIDELEDIGANVPNFFLNSFNNDPNTVRLFIRGVGQPGVQITQDPSVALYIDGVYVGTSIGAGTESVDLERVEILRGPQGTLYGRNATGGAVNLISAKPDLEKFSFKQSFTTGNLGKFKSSTHLNIPLSDTAAMKLSLLKSERDGVVENKGRGEDWGVEDREGARLAFRFEPSDELTVDYAYDHSKLGDTSRLEQLSGGAALNGNFSTPFSGPIALPGFSAITMGNFVFTDASTGRLDKATAAREHFDINDVEVDGHNLTVNWEVNENLSIKSITAFREFESIIYHDGTPTTSASIDLVVLPPGIPAFGINPGDIVSTIRGPGPVSASVTDTEYEQFSFELQALGSVSLDNGGELDYATGLYYFSDESEQEVPQAWSFDIQDPNAFVETENESVAIFGQFTYTPASFEQNLHLTLGLRYSKDKREAGRINEGSLSFAALGGYTTNNCQFQFASTLDAMGICNGAGGLVGPEGTIEMADYDEDFSNFNPSLTVAYDINEDVNVYAKWVSGYKSGGTSQRSANPTNFAAGAGEEDVESYEIGLKGDFLDRRLRVNAAIFRVEIEGLQASVQTGSTAGQRDFVGVDDSSVNGLELDITALLSENWTATFGYGYLDSEYGTDEVTLFNSVGDLLTMNVIERFAYAPDTSYTLAVDYARELDIGRFAFHVNYSYQDDADTSMNSFDNRMLEDRGLVDMSMNLAFAQPVFGGQLRISLWGKNLSDKEYKNINAGSLSFAGIDEWATWGDPRTYGATVSWSY